MAAAPSKRPSRLGKGAGSSGERPSVPLRLTVSGGALGLELYQPLPLEALVVEELAWTLPHLRFPLDLSGGVDVFRHRRGLLTRLGLRASFAALSEHLRERLRPAFGRGVMTRVWPAASGVAVGIACDAGALAFELGFVPAFGDVRWVVHNARGVGEFGVPLARALEVAATWLGGAAEREGRSFVMPRLAARLCRELVPSLGARAPDAKDVRVASLDFDADGFALRFGAGELAPPALSAVRAHELARLTVEADDAVARGDFDRARERYLAALERAPRHPDIVLLIAQIDVTVAERAEGALGMLTDCMPATSFGLTGARLLARVRDLPGAREALRRAAADEPYAPLAAGLWQALAALGPEPAERRDALDRAVAAAPWLGAVRWSRLEARVEWGDERGALADAESLEAGAASARERLAVLTRAADRLVRRGYVKSAGQLFERALRYAPDDPRATCGLARALSGSARPERAVALLERAIELAEASPSGEHSDVAAEALVELARVLAERCGDLPQAIARVSRVPATSERHVEALALEARWRVRLGDLRGASLAFARLRDACELSGQAAALPEAALWLTEAATLEQHSLGDLAAAERHLASALRLAPRDAKVRRLYRQTAAALARQQR